MKRYISLFLVLIMIITTLTLISCKSNSVQSDTEKNDNTDTTIDHDSSNDSSDNDDPRDVFYGYTDIHLTEDPYFDEEGRLVLNFEEAITYYPTASVFVGVVDKSSAESYPAHPDMEAYPEMRTEEGMTGIAIKTETPLELKSGEKYTFSVTIMNAFICEFEMTIK